MGAGAAELGAERTSPATRGTNYARHICTLCTSAPTPPCTRVAGSVHALLVGSPKRGGLKAQAPAKKNRTVGRRLICVFCQSLLPAVVGKLLIYPLGHAEAFVGSYPNL